MSTDLNEIRWADFLYSMQLIYAKPEAQIKIQDGHHIDLIGIAVIRQNINRL